MPIHQTLPMSFSIARKKEENPACSLPGESSLLTLLFVTMMPLSAS